MRDTLLDFVSLLRSGDAVGTNADRILKHYRKTGLVMSKDNTSNDAAKQFRLRAEAARRRALVCEDAQQKLVELRRAEDFEKMASEAERHSAAEH